MQNRKNLVYISIQIFITISVLTAPQYIRFDPMEKSSFPIPVRT